MSFNENFPLFLDHVTGIRWKRLKLRGLTRVKEISSSGIYKYQGKAGIG